MPISDAVWLHLADVLVENDDIIGDGANLASRIQQAGQGLNDGR